MLISGVLAVGIPILDAILTFLFSDSLGMMYGQVFEDGVIRAIIDLILFYVRCFIAVSLVYLLAVLLDYFNVLSILVPFVGAGGAYSP